MASPEPPAKEASAESAEELVRAHSASDCKSRAPPPVTELERFSSAPAPAAVYSEPTLPGLELKPGEAIPGHPKVIVGTKIDAAAVLCGGNPLRIDAIVNCARDDWLDQEQPGGVSSGDLLGISYCTLNARDRDRIDPIIIDGEVAVPGLKAYEISQHFEGALRFIRECLAEDKCVLIHCLRGENRAGAIAAAFLAVDGGLDMDTLTERLRKIRGSGALSNRAFAEQVAEFAKSARDA